jgi:predicted XRE-type DNA-binding protein
MIKKIPEMTLSDINRFWSKVNIKGTNDCWLWIAGRATDGYGQFHIKNWPYRAHRVAMALSGKKSTTLLVLHDPIKCNNPLCCNPKHLRFGTPGENSHDIAILGDRKGSKQPWAKLTESDIPIIRKLAEKMIQQEIADLFDVTQSAISGIILGKTWQHVIGMATDKEVKAKFPHIRMVGKKWNILPASDILLIRKLSETMTQRAVGSLFNVSRYVVFHILSGKAYKHVLGIATDIEAKKFLQESPVFLSNKFIENKCAKLTSLDIPIIRKLVDAKTQTEVAHLFNVKTSAINDIIHNKTWKHVIGVATTRQVTAYLKKNNLTLTKTKV